MFRGRFLGFMLVVLLIVGLFGLVSSSIYRAGWSEGYVAGQVTTGGEDGDAAVAPHAYGRYASPGWGFFPFFGFLGGIFKFFLFFLLLGLIFKFVGLLFWHKRGRGGKHWGWHHEHRPPWYGEEVDEPIMKA